MSKLWLCLLLVAAFQAVHSYPTEFDYLEDAESTIGIIKDAWGKIKDKYTDMGKEKMQQVVDKLKEQLCKQADFEEDFDLPQSDEQSEPSSKVKILIKLRELLDALKDAAEDEKAKIRQDIEKLRAQFCSKLNDVNFQNDFEEDEESTIGIIKDAWGKIKDKYTDMGKEKMQQVVDKLKERLCKQADFEEDFDLPQSDEESEPSNKVKILKKLRELLDALKDAAEDEKAKIRQDIEKLKAQFCSKLNDVNFQNDVEEDEESTADILKDAWDKLKDKYSQIGKDALQKLLDRVKEKMCQNHSAQEDSDDSSSEEKSEPFEQVKILQAIRILLAKLKNAVGEDAVKIEKKLDELRTRFCNKLNTVKLEEDFEEDESESTKDILKEAWDKLKEKYSKLGKEQMKKIINKLNERMCTEEDFEEDFAQSDEETEKITLQDLVGKLRELLKKAKKAAGEEREKIHQDVEKLRKKFCNKLKGINIQEDVDDEEEELERIKWGKLADKLGNALVKGLKKMKGPMKKMMKSGAKLLKKNAIKVTPLQCHDKTCKSCVSFLAQSFGDVPRCLDIGEPVGRICLKGLEGLGKSSKGKAKANFCLAILAENYGVGCKFCASYQDKKMKVRFAPKIFAGGKSEDGDIVQMGENEEDGIELDADEFEIEDEE